MAKTPRLLWMISFHHACNDGTLMALVALIPILVEEMNLSYYEVGVLGFGLIITVVVQYVVGRFADRIFSRYLLEIGALLMGASFLLLLLVSDFAGLFLAVISMRIGGAFYHPVGTSWITREYAGKYLETALGIQSGVGNFGVIIALGTTGFLGEMFTWKAPCLVWAGLNFTAVLLGLALIKEEGIKTRVSKQTKRVPSKSTLSKMWFLVIPIIAGGALYQVTSYFGPVRLTEVAGWSAGNADLIFAMWIGIGTITSYYFGAMSYRFGKTRLLLAGYIVSAIAAVILAFALDWFIMGPVLLIYGAFLFITFPALFSTLNDVTDESERGTAFGLLFGFQLGGGAFVVYICGIVVDALDNPDYAFVIVAILAAASAITMFTKNLSQRGRSNLESTGSDLSSRV
jgi:predicted MFS family arabinose efflux permease